MNYKSTALVPLVEVHRSGRLECIHFGHVAVCDAKGKVILSRGDPTLPTYLRSSAKPFQGMTAVYLSAAERWGLTDDEVATICASHGAQPLHLRTVESILKKCGLTPDHLRCGPHPPGHEPSADALIRAGEKPERIHNNCSGKHSGMLAAAKHKGWPLETYLEPDHPHQQQILKTVSAFTDLPVSEIPAGVDGCGVPSFYMPLTAAATAYARLGTANSRPKDYGPAAERIVKSICTHPVHIAYEGQFGTILLQHLGEHVVAKSGAEGVYCAGIREKGIGVAVKIIDGGKRAIPPLMAKLLEQFLHEVSVEEFRKAAVKPILNTLKKQVGSYRVVGL